MEKFLKLTNEIEKNSNLMALLEIAFQAGAEAALEQNNLQIKSTCKTCESLARSVMMNQTGNAA